MKKDIGGYNKKGIDELSSDIVIGSKQDQMLWNKDGGTWDG